MSVFDDVAKNPKEGDVLAFAGGYLRYRVISQEGLPPIAGAGVLVVREYTKEEDRTAIVPFEVWTDLVRFSATVSRQP